MNANSDWIDLFLIPYLNDQRMNDNSNRTGNMCGESCHQNSNERAYISNSKANETEQTCTSDLVQLLLPVEPAPYDAFFLIFDRTALILLTSLLSMSISSSVGCLKTLLRRSSIQSVNSMW